MDLSGNFPAAIGWYSSAINLTQYKADAYFNMGRIHYREKLYDLAVKCYDEIIKIVPEWSRPYLLRAICLKEYDRPRFSKAVSEFLSKFPYSSIEVASLLYSVVENRKLKKPFEIDHKKESKCYHYTKLEALKNILETGSLRITRIDFLNDLSERIYITSVLEKLIEIALIDNRFNRYKNDFIQDVRIVKILFKRLCEIT